MALANLTNNNTDSNSPTSPPNQPPFPPPFMQMMGAPTKPPTSKPDILVDYNERFAKAAPALHRDSEVHNLSVILTSRSKPNALLIGPAGVGKTRIVEELARRIANRDPSLPATLSEATVYELPLGSLIAGTGVVGSLEARLEGMIMWLANNAPSILFIDEAHLLTTSHYDNVSQILKPALARGEFYTILATTNQEARNLSDDPALSRRFSRVIVPEMSLDQTRDVLASLVPELHQHHNHTILIDDTTLDNVIAASADLRAPGSHLPDAAITLLDRVASECAVARCQALAAAQASGNQQLASALSSAGPKLISARLVSETAKKITNGGADLPNMVSGQLIDACNDLLHQDQAIATIDQAVFQHNTLRLFPDKRPLSFLMAGPSGSGKSETTRRLASLLTGKEPITLNLTEYHHSASINRIIGSPAGYIGSESKRELPFDKLESNPFQVILLDELEKADRSVQRLFMSVLEDGCMQMASGKTIDFSHAIVVATTNAGSKATSRQPIGFNADADSGNNTMVKSLSDDFDKELLGRFTHILRFNPIEKGDYIRIVSQQWSRDVTAASVARYGLPEIIPDDVLASIVADFAPALGARPAKKAVRAAIAQMVADLATP